MWNFEKIFNFLWQHRDCICMGLVRLDWNNFGKNKHDLLWIDDFSYDILWFQRKFKCNTSIFLLALSFRSRGAHENGRIGSAVSSRSHIQDRWYSWGACMKCFVIAAHRGSAVAQTVFRWHRTDLHFRQIGVGRKGWEILSANTLVLRIQLSKSQLLDNSRSLRRCGLLKKLSTDKNASDEVTTGVAAAVLTCVANHVIINDRSKVRACIKAIRVQAST